MDWNDIFRAAGGVLHRSPWLGDVLKNFPSDAIAAVVTYCLGWVVSLRVGRQRRKDRIVDELILSQRELVKRAYPQLHGEVWRENAQREGWMLDPFVARIEFLIASMREDKALTLREIDLLEVYVAAKRRFIEKWCETRRRGEAYHQAYRESYYAMRTAAKALGLNQMKRLRGLMPRDDLLDGGSPPPAVTPSAPPKPSNGGLAPAE